jgi:hypothetical protein
MMRSLWAPILVLALLGVACSGDSKQTGADAEEVAGGQERPQSTTGGATGKTPFPPSLTADWNTDFSKTSVSPDELTRGQVKDGIPALSQPKFLTVGQASFLKGQEPVVAFESGADARAYPLQILIWHEIVNDVVAGQPVLITFCPLCNTAIAFDRSLNGRTLEFGVSGFLRNSDLVMFDRETESWWQQVTGEAIVGELTGSRLELLPSSIVSWADFAQAFPDGKVLSRDTGHRRDYGTNPYVGYDDVNSSPFLFDGKTDSRLAAMERVVTVELGGELAAYPFSRLEKQPVVADSVGGTAIVVFFKRGTSSALDRSTITDSRDIGSAAVFKPQVAGQELTFRADGNAFIDSLTGSRWDIFGKAVSGPLKGKTLEPVVSGNHFWFAWAAFKPETRVWSP